MKPILVLLPSASSLPARGWLRRFDRAQEQSKHTGGRFSRVLMPARIPICHASALMIMPPAAVRHAQTPAIFFASSISDPCSHVATDFSVATDRLSLIVFMPGRTLCVHGPISACRTRRIAATFAPEFSNVGCTARRLCRNPVPAKLWPHLSLRHTPEFSKNTREPTSRLVILRVGERQHPERRQRKKDARLS